jgi:voltage-gated potassium channel
MRARLHSVPPKRETLRMARDTDVGGSAISALWRRPLAGGRSIDGWMEERTERLLQGIAQRPVRLAIILLVCNRAIGGALYSVTEPDSDWFDGAWWVLVTQTTVGYGDFAPESFLGRATAELVMWTGILAVAILTAALAGVIAERRLERARTAEHLQTVSLDDDFDHLIARLESDTSYLCEHLRRLKDVTNDPRVVAALADTNLPKEKGL